MPAHYPWFSPTTFQLFGSLLLGQGRSIHADAQALVTRLDPPLDVRGKEYIPQSGPCVITVNHYSRPGFPSWWITLAVNAVVPADIHWIMTEAWTFPVQSLKHHTITPLTLWAFARIARVYGFTTMPPMPPDPRDAARRAHAVRQVLAYARNDPGALLGLAPEGGDSENGVLQAPPSGAGRFMLHLAAQGMAFVPAGVFETGNGLAICFGPPFDLSVPPDLTAAERDRQASQVVMREIARLLPVHLQGSFDSKEEDR